MHNVLFKRTGRRAVSLFVIGFLTAIGGLSFAEMPDWQVNRQSENILRPPTRNLLAERLRRLFSARRGGCRDTFEVTITEDRNDACRVGDCSLREAVMAANACPGRNTIEIPEGRYMLTLTGPEADGGIAGATDRFYDLDIFEEVTILGAGPDRTVIDGSGIDGFGIIDVLHPSGGSRITVISGIRLENGTGAGGGLAVGTLLGTVDTTVVMANSSVRSCISQTFGGGIIVFRNAHIQLLDVELRGNLAMQAGGGMYNWSGTASLVNVQFFNNKAVTGGGLYSQQPLGTDLGAGRVHLVITRSHFHDNLSVRNDKSGYAPSGGGLISVDEVVHIRDTQFLNNYSDGSGGAMGFGNPSFAVLTRVEVTQNEGRWGGGISNHGYMSIRDSKIRFNIARGTSGGGIYSSASVDIVETTFEGNEASDVPGDDITIQGRGGGIALFASGSIRQSTFYNNQASLGGGIYNAGISALANTTISRNIASDGGGIYNDAPNFYVKNCTVADNEATRGSGIFNHSSYPLLVGPDFPRMTVNHTIVADLGGTPTTTSLCYDQHFDLTGGADAGLFSGGYNLYGNTTCPFTLATDILAPDPGLDALASNDGLTFSHLPLPGSPAVNAGSSTTSELMDTPEALKRDQRGIQRPKHGNQPGGLRSDIGSVELAADNEWDRPVVIDPDLPVTP